jgi:hypothetical protein
VKISKLKLKWTTSKAWPIIHKNEFQTKESRKNIALIGFLYIRKETEVAFSLIYEC